MRDLDVESGQVDFYVLHSAQSALRLTATNYGARVVSLQVPDRSGNLNDVVLGFPDASGYLSDDACFGGILGRNANRISNAQFQLDGCTYHLTANEGANSNHSGPNGFEKRLWSVAAQETDSITFTLHSPDGDQGFPGSLVATVTYRIVGESQLDLTINGISNTTTIFNPTTHTYFNLDGVEAQSGTIEGQSLKLSASDYCPSDEVTYIPRRPTSVAGTPMDFRQARSLGSDLADLPLQLGIEHGFNHAFLMNGWHADGQLRPVAEVISPKSGISMAMESSAPSVLLYSADYLDGVAGKYGVTYGPRAGLCLEPGFVPNAINDPTQVQPILLKNVQYSQKTRYRFGTV